MYITQEADYAVRIVFCLAKDRGRRDARSISEEVCVTLRFSLKILGKLSAAGIVNSFKGNRGGYELACSPKDITLRDVLLAVEGPFAISRCIHEGECSRGADGICSFQHAFHSISQSVNVQLGEVDFQKLLEEDKSFVAG
ncbi:MAG: RrF2 family transcriptional regulator [Oscillospiraceae bacterium]